MSAGTHNFEVIRGNSSSRTFRFKDGASAFDLTGSEMIFRATYRAEEVLRKKTGDASLSMPTPTNGEVTLALTAVESRLIRLGALTRYEIERRIAGDQKTLVEGLITGILGENDDV